MMRHDAEIAETKLKMIKGRQNVFLLSVENLQDYPNRHSISKGCQDNGANHFRFPNGTAETCEKQTSSIMHAPGNDRM